MDIVVEQFLRLILSAAVCSLIGIEREISHKPAGLRTHVLVGLGSTLATLMATIYYPAEAARIMAGIVTGIGFLGAGSIIGSGKSVHGLTTAATVWVSSIVGIAIGAGFYLLAIMTTVIIIGVLLLKPIERKL